jgi:hypothetical protein
LSFYFWFSRKKGRLSFNGNKKIINYCQLLSDQFSMKLKSGSIGQYL